MRGIARDSRLGQDALGRAWREEETDLGPALPALRWIAAQERKLGGAARLREQVDAAPPDADLAALADDLRQAAAAWTERWNEIARILDLDPEEAFGASAVETVGAAILQARLGDWIAAPNEIEGWHRLASAARHVSEWDSKSSGTGWRTAAQPRLRRGVARLRARRGRVEPPAGDTEPRLESIDGEERSRKVEAFKRLDQQLQSLAAQEIVLRHFRSLPPGAAGQVGVIRGEVAKKTRHMKLRQLLDKAGEAVAAIKPVFLMSPLSVAQYLTPGGLTFDLLLIDEASQVRPADAMGAIMRCRQVVVVGDQKQMPPDVVLRPAGGERGARAGSRRHSRKSRPRRWATWKASCRCASRGGHGRRDAALALPLAASLADRGLQPRVLRQRPDLPAEPATGGAAASG